MSSELHFDLVRTRRARARRQGGVLLEALIVLSTVMAIFGLMTMVHRAALADIDSLQQARADAWRHAAAGCPSGGVSLRDALAGLGRGELPLPDAYLPTHFSAATATRTARGVRGQATRSVRIPCNSQASSSDESAGDWVFDVLGP